MYSWARAWNIPFEAVDDLRERLSMDRVAIAGEGSEARAQSEIRLEAAEAGLVLWRNNVGAARMEDGSFLRYGICNDSKALNARIKSSDLVGIRPLLITPEHVGTVVGQFIAREVKRPGWSFSGSDRERGQLRFLEIVLAYGGDAAFATGRGSL